MQTDMHYYANYALARAAGIREDIARAIATAGEYVDDCDSVSVVCADGFKIDAEPTAHHAFDVVENKDPKDQRRTWVPFHFIPGNEGATAEERLVCRKDSAIARQVVANTLDHVQDPFGPMLLGITAHAYGDTFAHYGFSGISSDENRINGPTIRFLGFDEGRQESFAQQATSFFNRYIAGPTVNFLAKLGHGSVATYPDQPYLVWQFEYEDGEVSAVRNNPETFLEACEKLHAMYVDARKRLDGDWDDLDSYRDFPDMKPAVKTILGTVGDKEVRAQAWQSAARADRLYKNPRGIAMPPYNYGFFVRELLMLKDYDEQFARRTVVFNFLEASKFYRSYLLDDLLMQKGLDVMRTHVEWYE